MATLYDRKNKKYIEDNKKSKVLEFLYNTPVGRGVLKIFVINPFTSKLGGVLISTKLSKVKIKGFIVKNNINMKEYEVKKYKSFNDFFIRKIDLKNRPMSNKDVDFISPADSKLLVYKIDDDLILNIKKSKYTLSELVNNNYDLSSYKNGYALVFRLSVDDYHHYCYIDDGETVCSHEIKGKLHTVQSISENYKIYSENHRVFSVLKTKNFDEMVYMEVGAIMVGKIVNRELKKFLRGDEKGYFKMGGSTIVVLIKDNVVKIDKDILDNSEKGIETIVKYRETIGKKITM